MVSPLSQRGIPILLVLIGPNATASATARHAQSLTALEESFQLFRAGETILTTGSPSGLEVGSDETKTSKRRSGLLSLCSHFSQSIIFATT
jgi:hypothetical protein